MLSGFIFCSYLNSIKWLQNNLIACPFKKLTGIDCPGCGFQRAVIYLLQGDVNNSLYIYPATIPLLITGVAVAVSKVRSPDKPGRLTLKVLYFTSGILIISSYLFKLTIKH